jgi:hypothetical protein
MPMSSTEGKSWILERVQAAAADRALDVLDIGPGVGTYAKLLAGAQVASLVAIEIFEPYVHTYRLGDYYDQVLIGDARTTPFPDTDIVILGDVAEHMSAHDAVALWQKAATAARVAVYLSIPIVHYPQGHIEGNVHEAHVVDDWNHDRVLAAFTGIGQWWTGIEIGVYERLVG